MTLPAGALAMLPGMSSNWAAVTVAALGLLFGAVAWIWAGGRRASKVDAAIDLLSKIAGDHEIRLRDLERPPPRPVPRRR